jgi:hypothetical protein
MPKDRRNRLFECIGMDEGVGSPEGYMAETRREGTRIIPSAEQQHECYSLYRIGCTQEKRELLYQAGGRNNRGPGESGVTTRRLTAMGETAATAMGRKPFRFCLSRWLACTGLTAGPDLLWDCGKHLACVSEHPPVSRPAVSPKLKIRGQKFWSRTWISGDAHPVRHAKRSLPLAATISVLSPRLGWLRSFGKPTLSLDNYLSWMPTTQNHRFRSPVGQAFSLSRLPPRAA